MVDDIMDCVLGLAQQLPQVFPLDQKEAGHAAKTAEVRRLPLGKELSGVTPFGKIFTPSFVE